MLSSLRISSPVSCSVPASVATSASVAGWPQVALMEERWRYQRRRRRLDGPSAGLAISAIPVVA